MKNKNDTNKNTIDKPHDKALFLALKNHDVARDAMRAYLPELLLSMTTLKNIRLYKTKLLTPEFKAFEADIMYEIELADQTGLILFHCEQQSTIEKNMPLRIWQYLLLVLMEYAANHPEKPLPIVYPIILYTGEDHYHESTDIFDLFGKHKDLAKEYLLNPIKLVDICRMTDADIQKHELFGLSEYAFKHKKTKQFEKFLEIMMPWAHKIELQLGKDYAKMVIRYVVDVFPDANYDALIAGTERYLSKELGDEAMTIAQQLEQRGMQRGRLEGKIEGKLEGKIESSREIAKNMLLMNEFSVETIAIVTHLSVDEVKAMKTSLEPTKH